MDLMQLRSKRNQIMQQNQEALKENLRLTREIQKLKTNAYIKQTARQELGLIQENEVIYLIPE